MQWQTYAYFMLQNKSKEGNIHCSAVNSYEYTFRVPLLFLMGMPTFMGKVSAICSSMYMTHPAVVEATRSNSMCESKLSFVGKYRRLRLVHLSNDFICNTVQLFALFMTMHSLLACLPKLPSTSKVREAGAVSRS